MRNSVSVKRRCIWKIKKDFLWVNDVGSHVAIVGLGYVGMPMAVAFAEKGLDVIGFDISEAKIELYNKPVRIVRLV